MNPIERVNCATPRTIAERNTPSPPWGEGRGEGRFHHPLPAIIRPPTVILSAASVILNAAKSPRRARRAFTLVELLVVIAIIGMLVGLALPAINAARESGRVATCKNNLRQLALAALSHESSHGCYPSGGWGERWAPVPGRLGQKQPASWPWAILPFFERNDLAAVGQEGSHAEREAQITRLLQTPLVVMHCPSRRQARAYPIALPSSRQLFGAQIVAQAARSDYAINAGDQRRCEIGLGWPGPLSLAAGDDPQFSWPDVSDHTGVSYLRSQITTAQLQAGDGTSRTYLFGEKALPPADYFSGTDLGDDFPLYSGYSNDTHRSAYMRPVRDGGAGGFGCAFGSAHPTIWNAAFADGAVRSLTFELDLRIHRSLANRRDGLVFGDDLIQ